MSNIQPFRGLRYNLKQISNPSLVITPPYDIISPDERISYHQRSTYNIIRLEFGEDLPDDSLTNNKYSRAAATLNDWLQTGILIREEYPAYYIVEEEFQQGVITEKRCELIAAVRLEDYDSRKVRPHELITKEPAIDRMNLLRACNANISPIMGLIHTKEGELTDLLGKLSDRTPDMITEDAYGVTQRLCVITDQSLVKKVDKLLADQPIYIADGHHRYDTALHYKKEQSANNPVYSGNEPFNFVMMSLLDSKDPSLVMLPAHRLVKGLEQRLIEQLEETLSLYFEVDELLAPLSTMSDSIESWLRIMENKRTGGVVLGLYGPFDRRLCILRFRSDADINSIMNADELRLWKDYDVFLLQRVVLQNTLGIDSVEKISKHLSFTRDVSEAISWVDSGECQIAFLVNPAPVSRVIEAADSGMRLPQKSTYFHPKTPAGLVINPIWND